MQFLLPPLLYPCNATHANRFSCEYFNIASIYTEQTYTEHSRSHNINKAIVLLDVQRNRYTSFPDYSVHA